MLAQANEDLQLHSIQQHAGRDVWTPTQDVPKNRLYVGGIPGDIGVRDLHIYFSTWGCVWDVYIPRLQRRGRANYCFVTFSNEQAARRCLEQSPLHINGKVRSMALSQLPIVQSQGLVQLGICQGGSKKHIHTLGMHAAHFGYKFC